MAESKIDFSFDNLHFSCEGDKDWVEAQLNQVLNRIPGLNKSDFSAEGSIQTPEKENGVKPDMVVEKKERNKRESKIKLVNNPQLEEFAGDPLFEFLKGKSADKNQVKKFLATAVYLHSHGVEKFSTPMVSKSLKSAHIEKLLNASDCLNKNEKKGFCIKDDKEFILTESGIRSIFGGEIEV